MKRPRRDALGRFLPRLKHDPLHKYVVLQEDGVGAFKTGLHDDAYAHAKAAGAPLVMTRARGTHTVLLAAVKPPRAVL